MGGGLRVQGVGCRVEERSRRARSKEPAARWDATDSIRSMKTELDENLAGNKV